MTLLYEPEVGKTYDVTYDGNTATGIEITKVKKFLFSKQIYFCRYKRDCATGSCNYDPILYVADVYPNLPKVEDVLLTAKPVATQKLPEYIRKPKKKSPSITEQSTAMHIKLSKKLDKEVKKALKSKEGYAIVYFESNCLPNTGLEWVCTSIVTEYQDLGYTCHWEKKCTLSRYGYIRIHLDERM